jgi:hypothetical protein
MRGDLCRSSGFDSLATRRWPERMRVPVHKNRTLGLLVRASGHHSQFERLAFAYGGVPKTISPEPARGRPTDLPIVGPRHGKVTSAVDRDREWVGQLAHEGAIGGEVPPCQVAQASVRSFHHLAAVEGS